MALRDALGVLVRDQPSDVGGSSAKAGHIEGGQSWQPAALLNLGLGLRTVGVSGLERAAPSSASFRRAPTRTVKALDASRSCNHAAIVVGKTEYGS